MMSKILGNFLIVATAVVLVAGDCIKDIPMVETRNGTLIPVAYERIKDPETDRVVKQIVADAISKFNDNIFRLLYIDNYHYVAYRQGDLVKEYCCQFRIVSYGCKKGITSDSCQIKAQKVCSVKAYKDYIDKKATLAQNSLYCIAVMIPDETVKP